MIYFLIRHKASGEFMPQARRGKGYSHWNPSNLANPFFGGLKVPRLIETEKKANKIIAEWNANPNSKVGYSTSYEGEVDYSIDIKSDGRKKEDLEVIKIRLIEIKKFKLREEEKVNDSLA